VEAWRHGSGEEGKKGLVDKENRGQGIYEFVIWCLKFVWNLEFGFWILFFCLLSSVF
jgi:hypothetical protein